MGVPLAAFLALYCKLEITGLWVGMVVMFMMQVREVSQECREVYLSSFFYKHMSNLDRFTLGFQDLSCAHVLYCQKFTHPLQLKSLAGRMILFCLSLSKLDKRDQ